MCVKIIKIGDTLSYQSINGCWYDKKVTDIYYNSKGSKIIHLENGVNRHEIDIFEDDDCDVKIKDWVKS